MSEGVRILIKIKDKDSEYGYIMRRLNNDLYEVYAETSQVVLMLSPSEFQEISREKNNGLCN